MKILYDHQAFTLQYFGGVSKSFCELIKHFENSIHCDISVEQTNNIHLLSSRLCQNLKPVRMDAKSFCRLFPFKGVGRLYTYSQKLFPFFNTAEVCNLHKSISLLKAGNFDVFHPTFFDDYFLPYLGKKPFVLTIHDMMPEIFPQYFKSTDMQIVNKKKLAMKASAVIAVSNKTKEDLIRILNIPDDKIHVIHHGGPIKELVNQPSLFDFPYFLYMGVRSGYKNFLSLVQAFSLLPDCYKNVHLVCTGGKFTKEEELTFTRLGVADRIIHIFPSDSDMKTLYANAIAFVFPSLYEGFGMPILEAYAYGCPTILNNKSCFPEIAQNASVYFSSDGVSSDLSERLVDAINWSLSERQTLVTKGYERLTNFSWLESSKKLASVYESVLDRF